MDLDTLIDRLEDLLDHSVRIPYSSRVVLNEDEYLRLVDQIRANVPDEIRRARQIEADRDAMLKQAAEQAEAMIAKARETASGLVSEHAVVAQAHQRAGEILEAADAQAASKKSDADAYAVDVLESLAGQVQEVGRIIDNGIRWLRQGEAEAADDPMTASDIEPNIVGQPPAAK